MRWLARWLSRSNKKTVQAGGLRSRPLRNRPLFFEACEPRELLASVTLTPVADNTIYQDATSNSNGAGASLFAGETQRGFGARRALLKFDVAGSVPSGAHIDSVTLQLHVSKDLGIASNFGVYLLSNSWGEGASNAGDPGGNGTQASTNDATWNSRFFNAAPAQPWSTPGGDFSAAASATTSIGGLGFFQFSSASLASDVQAWLNGTSGQFGWLVKAVDESIPGSAQKFDSRESLTAANQPKLTINYTAAAANLQPTLNAIGDPAAILEDAAQQTINLSGISAGGQETQNLTVTATSNNPSLIPNPTVNYTSPSSTGSLSYKPAANASGSAVITVKVQDDGGTAGGGIDTITRTFTVDVTAVNDQPTLNSILDPAAILEDAGQQTINLSGISAGGQETQNLSVTATSSNPTLIPNPAVSYNSPSVTGSLSYTPAANRFGSAVITVTVKDNGGTALGGVDSITRTFTVNVTAINDPPTLDAISDPPAILQDSGQQTVSLSGISAGPFETQILAITAASNNSALIPDPAVHYTSPNNTGSLTFSPAAGQTGSATITVTVKDNGGTALGGSDTIIRTFKVLVIAPGAVNQPPSFTKGADQSASDNSGPQTVAAWATNISAGPPSESDQTVHFIVSATNQSLFAVQPSVDPTGVLKFTPAPNAHGTTAVSVQLQDNGGTANGGADTSPAQTFNITINKPLIWHNTLHALDVTNSAADGTDNVVAAGDALAIINYINLHIGQSAIPPGSPFGPPYIDTFNSARGDFSGDNLVAPADALAVINFINTNGPNQSGPAGEGEAALAADAVFGQLDATTPIAPRDAINNDAAIASLLATFNAPESAARRRM